MSTQQVATKAFARAVIERLGEGPLILPQVRYAAAVAQLSGSTNVAPRTPAEKKLVGVDVFVDWRGGQPDVLGARAKTCSGGGLELTMIANRGVKVWPGGLPETFCTDHWRCRFLADHAVSHAQVIALLGRVAEAGLDFVKTEQLYTFDDQPGFSSGQGE